MKKFMNIIKDYILPVICIIVVGLITWPIFEELIPLLVEAVRTNNPAKLEAFIRSFGLLGPVLVVVLQILQVAVIILPAPLIWIPAGVIFGVWEGLIYCLIGLIIGNGLVFLMARRLHLFRDSKVTNKLNKLLNNFENEDFILLIATALPGMPNGFIPYLYANTSYSIVRFLIISAMGSVPSILMSTYIGHAFIQKQYLQVGIVIGIMAIVFAIFYFKQADLTKWAKKIEKRYFSSTKYKK